MKSKSGRKILIATACVLVLWLIVGITDFTLVRNYHKPLFCVGINLADDGGSGHYMGLGYGFDIEGYFMPEDEYPDVTSYRGYLFGREVVRGFWEEMLVGTDSPTQAGGNSSTLPQADSTGTFTGTIKEPPALTVICGESSTQALQGTYSWYYPNLDGTITGAVADCIHPLDAKELMEPLNLVPSYLSHIDPYTIYLRFEVAPDSVEISCWGEECWGRTDASFEHKAIPVNKTEDTDANGCPLIIYSLQRGEETAIYIITAKWESYENFNGTASYSFYTTYPLLEPQLITP